MSRGSVDRRPKRAHLIGAISVAIALSGCGPLDRLLPKPPPSSGQEAAAEAAADAGEDIPKIPTMVILDASGSMKADDAPGVRFTAAQRAVHTLVDVLPDDYQAGLLAYGTQTGSTDEEAEAGCRDITQPVAFGPVDRDRFKAAVNRLKPRGYTPIGLALQTGAERLPRSGDRTIVLVTDGIDTCAEEDLGPDPCDVAGQLHGDDPGLAIHVVGFKTATDADATKQLDCIADKGGGDNLDAANGPQLSSRLALILNPKARANRLSPIGYRGLELGMTASQARRAAPNLARIKKTGRVEIVYADCTLVFDDGVLVQIITTSDNAPTLDGIRVGDDVKQAEYIYGKGGTGRNRTYSTGAASGTGYRVRIDGDHRIIRIILCTCAPGVPDRFWKSKMPGDLTGAVSFTHPSWGPVVMATSFQLADPDGYAGTGFIRVIDSHGRVRWTFDTKDAAWEGMELNKPARDRTGNIFVNWNPGRLNGVTVLRPTVRGFKDFGTLMDEGDYNGSHYGAHVVDVDDDGIFEIEDEVNDCEPDCGSGKTYRYIYGWTGDRYAPDRSDCPAESRLREATDRSGSQPLAEPADSGGYFYDAWILHGRCDKGFALVEATHRSGSTYSFWVLREVGGGWQVRAVANIRSDTPAKQALFDWQELDRALDGGLHDFHMAVGAYTDVGRPISD